MLFKGWKSGNTQAAAHHKIMQQQPDTMDQYRWLDAHQLDFEEEAQDGHNTCADPLNEALPIAPQVLQQLDDFVCSPAFLHTLAGAKNQEPQNAADLCQMGAAPTEQEDFVLLEKADAVEAMAFFIASYVSSLPEAKSLTPQQLQSALGATFKAVRTSRFTAAWAWGKRVYRYAALGYSAFQMYENPWLIKATIKALWFFSKIAAGATVAALGAVAV